MTITSLIIEPLTLIPRSAFTIAYGSYPTLDYVLLKVKTSTGMIGLGEASPDPGVTGETQDSVIEALKNVSPILSGSIPLILRKFPALYAKLFLITQLL